jgi:hypothetical protein
MAVFQNENILSKRDHVRLSTPEQVLLISAVILFLLPVVVFFFIYFCIAFVSYLYSFLTLRKFQIMLKSPQILLLEVLDFLTYRFLGYPPKTPSASSRAQGDGDASAYRTQLQSLCDSLLQQQQHQVQVQEGGGSNGGDVLDEGVVNLANEALAWLQANTEVGWVEYAVKILMIENEVKKIKARRVSAPSQPLSKRRSA